MNRSLTTQDISWFLDLYEKEQLDLDPPYQRRSVWSSKDKRYFVDTILNNYPAPPIFLHKTLDDSGKPTYHVVDGKQRLQTIIDFKDNKIRIPDDFADNTLRKKRWNDLERTTREAFWNYVLIVEMLPNVGEAIIRNTFDRMNRNSRKLTAQELRHAKYEGWLASRAEAEAEKPDWATLGVVTAARAKRMLDIQFISELIAILLKDEISGFDQDALDELYAEYEDPSEIALFDEEQITEKIEAIKACILQLVELKPELTRFLRINSHFYSLWAYLGLHQLPEDRAAFSERYCVFLTDVAHVVTTPDFQDGDLANPSDGYRNAVVEYAANTRGASTDLAPRSQRMASLASAIACLDPSN